MKCKILLYGAVFAASAVAGFFVTQPASAGTRVDVVVSATPVHAVNRAPYWSYYPRARYYPRGYFVPRSRYYLPPAHYRHHYKWDHHDRRQWGFDRRHDDRHHRRGHDHHDRHDRRDHDRHDNDRRGHRR